MYKTPEFWLALGGTALAVAVLVLRFIAPRTKTKKDDEALEKLEEVAEFTGNPVKDLPKPKTQAASTVARPTKVDHRK